MMRPRMAGKEKDFEMLWLVLGVVLWSGVHFIPSLAPPLKQRLVGAIGENGYKGVISLGIVAAIALMVIGWRSADPAVLYDPPDWGARAAGVLMIVSFILFGASHHPSRIKQILRHPMLTGLVVWSLAHLLANGDSRSFVLFAGLGLWALVEMVLINARDRAWVKPPAPSLAVELRGLVISLVVFAVALYLHPYFAGVTPY